ncbi:MAG: VOC family protein [Bacteroidia bacterium]|nr:VOC family protein [Bacteroidia bacterium]
MKKRVTGIGGIFFKAKDEAGMKDWYGKHLGIDSDKYGHIFWWRDAEDKEKKGTTNWSIMKESTGYFNPSKQSFMINYRVENLDELLDSLKNEGVEVVGEPESHIYGKFAWILDPEGNKIELWEPIDEAFEEEEKA